MYISCFSLVHTNTLIRYSQVDVSHFLYLFVSRILSQYLICNDTLQTEVLNVLRGKRTSLDSVLRDPSGLLQFIGEKSLLCFTLNVKIIPLSAPLCISLQP